MDESMSQSLMYIPVRSPPTPDRTPTVNSHHPLVLNAFTHLPVEGRSHFLSSLLPLLDPTELRLLSSNLSGCLKRDFISDLPPELALHIIRHLTHDPLSIVRASGVCRYWHRMFTDEAVWKPVVAAEDVASWTLKRRIQDNNFTYRNHFRRSYLMKEQWKTGGQLHYTHKTPDGAVVTSLTIQSKYTIVTLNNNRIHIFSTTTSELVQTLHTTGAVWAVNFIESGPVILPRATPTTPRSRRGLKSPLMTGTPMFFPQIARSIVPGWGNETPLLISGGCEKVLRVWDIETGKCIHEMPGHHSTIRCVVTLPYRPVSISGSRDRTLRVWNVQTGQLLRTLIGHTDSVRCLDAISWGTPPPSQAQANISSQDWGARVVSGSYDCSVRVWNPDTGECLHVLSGHDHQIYAVCFSMDGMFIASGGLDTAIRIWSTTTGDCKVSLAGHTALVCALQWTTRTLVSGGADGRVVLYDVATKLKKRRTGLEEDIKPSHLRTFAAHDSSVSALQMEDGFPFAISGGDDGRVKIFSFPSNNSSSTGGGAGRSLTPRVNQIVDRDLFQKRFEAIWRVGFSPCGETLVVGGRRGGKTVVEMWKFDRWDSKHDDDGEDVDMESLTPKS